MTTSSQDATPRADVSDRDLIWSRSLRVDWNRRISHIRARTEALERLDEKLDVQAFQNTTNHFGVLFGGDRQYELQMHSSHLLVAVRTPTPDRDVTDRAIRVALEGLQFTPNAMSASFMHVVPLSQDYDEARRSATESLLTTTTTERYGLSDYSVLLDGRRNGLGLKVEMGVISAAEIPERLTRQAGRTGQQKQVYPPMARDDFDLPEVAYFSDGYWHSPALDDTLEADGVLEWWSGTADTATALTRELMNDLWGASEEQR